jgi:hypothetical protein
MRDRYWHLPKLIAHKVAFVVGLCLALPLLTLAQTVTYPFPGSAPGAPRNPTVPVTVTQTVTITGNCGPNPSPPSTTTFQTSENVLLPFTVQGATYNRLAGLFWPRFVLPASLQGAIALVVVNGVSQASGSMFSPAPITTPFTIGVTTGTDSATYSASVSGVTLNEQWTGPYNDSNGSLTQNFTYTFISSYNIVSGDQSFSWQWNGTQVSSATLYVGGPCVGTTNVNEQGSTTINWLGTNLNDQVQLNNNGSGSQTGLWLNGVVNGSQVDHQAIVPNSNNPIGLAENLTPSSIANGNEVVAFNDSAPPILLTNVQWTNGADTIPASFKPLNSIPIQVWNIGGSSSARLKAAGDIVSASFTALSERTGLSIQANALTDTKPTLSAPTPSVFICSQQNIAQIEKQFPLTPGMISVYYFPRVQGLTVDPYGSTSYTDINGCTDIVNANFIAISATQAPSDSLVHEIGHAMSLAHPCQIDAAGNCTGILANFDEYNVMTQQYGPTRIYFSEGQTFRMNFHPQSALSKVYGAPRSGARTCGQLESDLQCPALDRRLWPDGSLPAN